MLEKRWGINRDDGLSRGRKGFLVGRGGGNCVWGEGSGVVSDVLGGGMERVSEVVYVAAVIVSC